MGQVIILTGERGVGKSTVCRKAVELAQRRGYVCSGVLTWAHRDGRDVVDVRSGRRRRLTTACDGRKAVIQGRYRFDPRTLSWGKAAVSRATPCDLLVVDELGPLEIVRGRGWVNAFDVLQAGDYALALLVVRPVLVGRASDRLVGCALEVVTVTSENRDSLPVNLVETVLREMAPS